MKKILSCAKLPITICYITKVIAHRPCYAVTQPESVQGRRGVTSHADLSIEMAHFRRFLWFTKWQHQLQHLQALSFKSLNGIPGIFKCISEGGMLIIVGSGCSGLLGLFWAELLLLRCLGDRDVRGSGDNVLSHQACCWVGSPRAAELHVALALRGCKYYCLA